MIFFFHTYFQMGNYVQTKKALRAETPKCLILLWAHLESNQAPTDYESVALTE